MFPIPLKKRLHRLWWFLPVALFAGVDGLITLWGQPSEYWSEGYFQIHEANPLGYWLLSIHPLVFAAAGVPYLLLVASTILILPKRWAIGVAVVLTGSHAFGVCAWCEVLFSPPMFVWLTVIGVLLAYGLWGLWLRQRMFRSRNKPQETG